MKKRRFLRTLLITLLVIIVLYVGLSVFGASEAINIPRIPLGTTPAAVGLAYQDVSFPSRDDKVNLTGWFLPSSGKKVILFLHGGYENRVDYHVDTLNLARDLIGYGYNVLLVDLRGRGESGGVGHSMMNIYKDVGGSIDYLKSRGYGTEDTGIIGFCSGAASAAIFAGSEKVGALVLDGCFTSVWEMVTSQADNRGIPTPITSAFLYGVQLGAEIFYGYREANPIDSVARINSPTLFIHEGNDELISSQENERLYKASASPAKEIWEIQSALHSEGYRWDPSTYIQKVVSFLKANWG